MVQSVNRICPLLSIGSTSPKDCKRERCAWWHEYIRGSDRGAPDRCALVAIADALTDMNLIGVAVDSN